MLRERPTGDVAVTFAGDGRSIAAWTVSDVAVRSVDARGRVRTTRLSDDCHVAVRAAGAGRLLIACPETTPYAYPSPPRVYEVINVATGVRRRISVPNPYATSADGARPEFSAIGDHWISGRVGFHQGQTTFFHNWRTGRQVPGDADPFGANVRLDLDATGLERPLCAPFARAVHRGPLQPHDRFKTNPTVDGDHVLAIDRSVGGRGQSWTVGRCGEPRRPAKVLFNPLLGGGLLSWLGPIRRSGPIPRPTTTFLRRLSDGREFRLARNPAWVVRAGRQIVIGRQATATTFTVLRATVPRR